MSYKHIGICKAEVLQKVHKIIYDQLYLSVEISLSNYLFLKTP